MTMRKKLLITIACLSVILCTMIVGTFAWLTDKTGSVTNTFTPSNIKIGLTESDNLDLKMVPGTTITKDPVVTVAANSEKCWVFVEIKEELGVWSDNGGKFSDYLTYTVITGENGWTQLLDNNNTPVSGVYYREVDASETAQGFPVLKDNKIMVNASVTKGMMDEFYNAEGTLKSEADAKRPTLTFTAYACQREGFSSAAAAWAEIPKNP